MVLKINNKTITEWMRKVCLDGRLDEFVIEGTPDGLQVVGMEAGNTFSVRALLGRDCFEQYDETFRLPILNASKLLGYLSRLSGLIKIDIQENRLIMTSKDSRAEMLIATESLMEKKKEPSLTFEGDLEIDASLLHDVIKRTKKLDNSGLFG